jgi:uncharacterized protein with von Willebrand factor type A (vWA) domain
MTDLNEMLKIASKDIDFNSELIRKAPKMSGAELQNAIDQCIDVVTNSDLNIEIRERTAKEAKVLALMKLRRFEV